MAARIPPLALPLLVLPLLAARGMAFQAMGNAHGPEARATAPIPQDGWEEFVDGLKVRRTLAPPDAEADAPPTKAGDFCDVQFHAWELTEDGLARKRLLAAAAFGEKPRRVLVGEGREEAPLELALIGLRPGEGRQLLAPAGRWKGAAGPVLVDVQLLERKPGVKVELLQTRNDPKLPRAGKGDTVAFAWSLALPDAGGDLKPVEIPARPVSCALGEGTLVRGLDYGLRGMAEGESRRITVPAHLGYGDQGVGGDLIPPGSTLVFTVEMRKVEKRK